MNSKPTILLVVLFCLALSASGAESQAIPPEEGLVGHWQAEGDANDSSSKENHGTLEGLATFAPGKIGQAFSLGGIDDYVEIPFINASLGFSENGTVGAWVNLKTLETSPVSLTR